MKKLILILLLINVAFAVPIDYSVSYYPSQVYRGTEGYITLKITNNGNTVYDIEVSLSSNIEINDSYQKFENLENGETVTFNFPFRIPENLRGIEPVYITIDYNGNKIDTILPMEILEGKSVLINTPPFEKSPYYVYIKNLGDDLRNCYGSLEIPGYIIKSSKKEIGDIKHGENKVIEFYANFFEEESGNGRFTLVCSNYNATQEFLVLKKKTIVSTNIANNKVVIGEENNITLEFFSQTELRNCIMEIEPISDVSFVYDSILGNINGIKKTNVSIYSIDVEKGVKYINLSLNCENFEKSFSLPIIFVGKPNLILRGVNQDNNFWRIEIENDGKEKIVGINIYLIGKNQNYTKYVGVLDEGDIERINLPAIDGKLIISWDNKKIEKELKPNKTQGFNFFWIILLIIGGIIIWKWKKK